MKKILIVLIALSSACFADDVPVSTTNLASWLNFDKPVMLEYTFHSQSESQKTTFYSSEFGDPIWECKYSSDTQTLHSYYIAIFPEGTLFREQRSEREEKVSAALKMLKERKPVEGYEPPEIPWVKSELGVAIKTKPNGQKIFFTILGFGPGGSAYCAFTTLSDVP